MKKISFIIISVALLLISIAGATDLKYQSATTFTGDIDMDNNNIDDATYINATYINGELLNGVVTVGPFEWCNETTDGTADQVQIEAALAKSGTVYLITDSYFSISDDIDIPTDKSYQIIGIPYDGSNPEIRPSAERAEFECSGIVSVELANLNINYNGTNGIPVNFANGADGVKIHNCRISNVTQNTGSTVYGIKIQGYTTDTMVKNVEIYNNELEDIIGVPIWVYGVWDGDGLTGSEQIIIDRNRIIHGAPYTASAPFSAITTGGGAQISNNYILGYGIKGYGYDNSAGHGIAGGTDSIITNNVIIGCGGNGIIPGYRNLVIGNKIYYCGLNGIDYWYSSYSNIIGNYIMECGTNNGTGAYDRCGIDVCDHSSRTLINGNYILAGADQISDDLNGSRTAGEDYIIVTNIEKFRFCEGMCINISSNQTYRIDYIDMENDKIYIIGTLAYDYGDKATVVGVETMLQGINVGDNGQSEGYHTITNNFILGFDSHSDRIGDPTGSTLLEHTYIDDYIYTSDPGYLPSYQPYRYYNNGHYLAVYVYGVGQKEVLLTDTGS